MPLGILKNLAQSVLQHAAKVKSQILRRTTETRAGQMCADSLWKSN